MLIPTGFWSYSSSDDENSRGKLSQLRALLAAELQQQIGRTQKVNIFQDVAAIPPGADWADQIKVAIEGSSFIIPIVTPAFLQSEWCCQEVNRFREKEAALEQNDLVFPIHYVDTSYVDGDNREECYDPKVLEFLRSRQFMDFRHLRLRDYDQEDVARFLEKLAQGIFSVLRASKTKPRLTAGNDAARPAEAPKASVQPNTNDAPGKPRWPLVAAFGVAAALCAVLLYRGLGLGDHQTLDRPAAQAQLSNPTAQPASKVAAAQEQPQDAAQAIAEPSAVQPAAQAQLSNPVTQPASKVALQEQPQDAAQAVAKPSDVQEEPTIARPTSSRESCARRSAAEGDIIYCASSVLPQQFGISYGVENLFGAKSTAWVAGSHGYAIGEWILVDFKENRKVGGIVIENGYQKSDDIFYKNSRVKSLEILSSTGERLNFDLEDRLGDQDVSFPHPLSTEWIAVFIRSVFPGEKYTDTAISKLDVNFVSR